jgi:hypothetical protein
MFYILVKNSIFLDYSSEGDQVGRNAFVSAQFLAQSNILFISKVYLFNLFTKNKKTVFSFIFSCIIK